jgi:hypothetical protein
VTLHQKVNDIWVQCQRPYVKRNGVWVAAEQAWVKQAGAWVQAYNVSITPPDPPEMSLEIIEDYNTVKGVKTLNTRYIKVGVRLPGVANDSSLKLIRVLSKYAGKPPTGVRGGTYTKTPDNTYPNEPWSDWQYNQYGKHGDSSVFAYKQWPVNAAAGTTIKGDEDYYFTAWSTEDEQLWSAGVPMSIHIPKDSTATANVITKEARFQPNSSGRWKNADGFHSGDLIQQKSPKSMGLWFYGNQFTDSFRVAPANVTIKSAQIFVQRDVQDDGAANANLYLFWTTYGSVGGLPTVNAGITRNETAKIGVLAKGQGKWFNVPSTFNADLKAGTIKGLGLDWKDPSKADANPDDYSQIMSVADNLRCGEVHMVWEEKN